MTTRRSPAMFVRVQLGLAPPAVTTWVCTLEKVEQGIGVGPGATIMEGCPEISTPQIRPHPATYRSGTKRKIGKIFFTNDVQLINRVIGSIMIFLTSTSIRKPSGKGLTRGKT